LIKYWMKSWEWHFQLFSFILGSKIFCLSVDPEFMENEEWAAYLCGNSVGLKPKCTDGYIQRELGQWAEMFGLLN
jgi:hypothetical protein